MASVNQNVHQGDLDARNKMTINACLRETSAMETTIAKEERMKGKTAHMEVSIISIDVQTLQHYHRHLRDLFTQKTNTCICK